MKEFELKRLEERKALPSSLVTISGSEWNEILEELKVLAILKDYVIVGNHQLTLSYVSVPTDEEHEFLEKHLL